MPALRKVPRADSSVPGEGISIRDRAELREAIRSCPYRLRTNARIVYLRRLAKRYRVGLQCIYKYQAAVNREVKG